MLTQGLKQILTLSIILSFQTWGVLNHTFPSTDIEIVELTKDNLFDSIETTPYLFVYFHDAYDGVMEKQIRELYKAGAILKEIGLEVSIGRFEGQVTPQIEKQLKVFKFPKLIFFTKGARHPYNSGKMSR